MTAGEDWDGDWDNTAFDSAAFLNAAFDYTAFDADDGQEPSAASARPDLGWHATGFGHQPETGMPEAEQVGQPVAGDHRMAEQFGQALDTFVVDSGSLRSRVLTGTAAAQRDLAAGERPPDAARRRPRARPRSARRDASRPGGGPVSGAHRARRVRPRLVTASALAAMVGAIGVSAGIAGAFDGASPASGVAMTTMASPTSPTEPPVAPQSSAATVDQALSAPQSQPMASPSTAVSVRSGPGSQQPTSGTSGRGGRTPWGGGGGPRAVSGWTVAPLHSGSQLVLPQKSTVDWVVFGEGRGGVAARAAVPFQSIDVSGIAGAGTPQRGYPTSVSWSWGTPRSGASHYTTRLLIPGGRPVSLTSVRGPHTGNLILVVGGVPSLRVNVSANGTQSAGFTVRLPSSTAMVTIDLRDLPYWTSATISLAGDHGSSFSLAAAVLN